MNLTATSISVVLYIHLFSFVYIYIYCMYIYIYMQIRIHTNIYIYIYIYVHIYIYMDIHINVLWIFTLYTHMTHMSAFYSRAEMLWLSGILASVGMAPQGSMRWEWVEMIRATWYTYICMFVYVCLYITLYMYVCIYLHTARTEMHVKHVMHVVNLSDLWLTAPYRREGLEHATLVKRCICLHRLCDVVVASLDLVHGQRSTGGT